MTPDAGPDVIRTASRLVERDWELEAIDQALAAARHGQGSVVHVQSAPGMGKTALLHAAATAAAAAGAEVLTASGTRLERDFPFGLALALLEPVWLRADPRDRESLLLGAAGPAAELLGAHHGAAAAEEGGAQYRMIHALYWLARNLAALRSERHSGGPLVLIVDDLQWADEPSARFVAYLARRLRGLPLLLVVGSSTVPSGRSPDWRGALSAAHATVLTPSPLSLEGVDALVRRRYPKAPAALADAVRAASAGNPFLVHQLLDQAIRLELPAGTAADRALTLVPEAVVDATRRVLTLMPPEQRRVTVAAAILGQDASIATVAELSGVTAAHIPPVLDQLQARGHLAPGVPLTFVQPLMRSAVLAALPAAERSQAHARAARLLTERGARPDQIAPHLIATIPGSEPDGIERLRACAQDSRAAGAARLAVSLLERALLEEPSADIRAELTMELSLAEAEAGIATAGDRLSEAKQLTSDPTRYAEIALIEARRLYGAGDYRRAAETLESALQQLGSAEASATRELKLAYVTAGALVPGLEDRVLERRDEVLGEDADPPLAERVAIAHTLLHDAIRGIPGEDLGDRGRRAWGEGALLDEIVSGSLTLPLLLGSLVVGDQLELHDEIAREALQPYDGRRLRWLDSALRPLRGWSLFLRGRVSDAEAEARIAVDLDDEHWPAERAAARLLLVRCHIERGQLPLAEAALDALADGGGPLELIGPARLAARSELRLAQHRADEALDDALRAAEAFAALCPGASPAVVPWGALAASAYLALGRPEAARELIEPELHESRRYGIGRVTVRSLRLLGLTAGGDEGLALLTQAVEAGDELGERLEQIRALVDLGAALRRVNRRAAAREPLRRALDLSHRGGAAVLAERARTEMQAAGARPRRHAESGVESLTASQRRVAELAARGLTTRQIAEALFVSPKTVEFHLRHAYRKLDVSSRAELSNLFLT